MGGGVQGPEPARLVPSGFSPDCWSDALALGVAPCVCAGVLNDFPPMPTHYETLSVPPSASKEEIRRAYRGAARLLHPDTNPSPDAAARFATLSAAYQVLSDARARREYDRSLEGRGAPEHAQPAQAHYTWTNIATDAAPKPGAPSIGQRDFDEMYNAYFGQGKKSRPRPG